MLHHISVGVADVERAAKFYDAALGALGYRRMMEFLPHGIGYGDKYPNFWVQLPRAGQACFGNGSHVGFKAKNKRAVEAFHRAALAAGGTDNGAPGPRPNYGPEYYGAFVIDLDGNHLEAVTMQMPAKAKPKTKAKAKPKPKPKIKAKAKPKAKSKAAKKTSPARKKAAPKRKRATRKKKPARKR